ncbi:hypothetical protein FHETE_5285 [Fusarium heterosporum]|uniref:Uncharacterized protein n=1 Tax=Fusarium heterosporum TaxID=42747 RepID=A0A8H5T9X7_FUSHE|nr:hypothetical protein FHETE_5285 [Fusarium heterosporum]
MKTSIILTLPFLAFTAAAPAKLDERQPVKVPKLDPDVQCPIQIAKSIHVCFPDVVAGDPIGLTEINRCLEKLSKSSGRAVRLETVPCVF